MSDDNAKELLRRGDRRFGERQQLDSMRQEIALNFAPHLAEWTTTLNWGADYAAHLVDSTPLLMARDFIGLIASTLRPSGKQYFWHRTSNDDINNDREVREYLDWRSSQMMRIMTDKVTGFTRACRVADEFYALFGDAVLSVDANDLRDSLRVNSYHTKDCVWAIGNENRADTITRRSMMPARLVVQRFRQERDKVHEKVRDLCERNGDEPIEVRHEVLPADEYDSYVRKIKPSRRGNRVDGWYSVWIDVGNRHVMRETWQRTFKYVVPRWITMAKMPYGIAPTTTIALPDGRMIQQQALAIMEAAEKQITPPLIATHDTIRGDIRLDGITWVDRSYDERNGDPLRMLELGKNFQLGVASLDRTAHQLTRAFYLDVLRLPDTARTKSIPEVNFAIDEYVRSAVPLFAPIHDEYNTPLLYEIDTQIDELGGYNRPVPDALKENGELIFAWDNPLTDMLERQKAQKAAELAQLGQSWAGLEAAAAQSPTLQQVDTAKGFRSSAIALGVADWLLDEKEAAKRAAAGAQAQQMQQVMSQAPNISKLIDSGVGAAQAAQGIPNPAEPAYPVLPAPGGGP